MPDLTGLLEVPAGTLLHAFEWQPAVEGASPDFGDAKVIRTAHTGEDIICVLSDGTARRFFVKNPLDAVVEVSVGTLR